MSESLSWKRVDANRNVYYQTSCKFPQGHFHLKVWQNGTVRVMVDVDPPGLDAKGLVDLGLRISNVIYGLTGKHVSLNDLEVDNLREFNVDSSHPELHNLLQLSGVKSGLSYSQLLETYLRIYEKSPGVVRVETGGKNAFELMREIRTPISVLESQARMPDELLAALNQVGDKIENQVKVLSQGMANVFQQQQRDHQLSNQLTSSLTVLVEELRRDRESRERDREFRERHEANLNDAVEILLTQAQIAERIKDIPEKKP